MNPILMQSTPPEGFPMFFFSQERHQRPKIKINPTHVEFAETRRRNTSFHAKQFTTKDKYEIKIRHW